MKYYQTVLQSGENVVYASKIHWMIYARGVLLLAISIFAFLKQSSIPGDEIIHLVAILFLILGIVSLVRAFIRRSTTEMVVTDRRVISKRGVIARHTMEINMEKIESVDVRQSLFGRLFDYGAVIVRGTGSSYEPFPLVDSPLEFRNSIHVR